MESAGGNVQQAVGVESRGWRTGTAQTKSCPLSVFANKVLLACSHAHWFTHCLWLLSPYEGRVEQVHQRPRHPVAHKTKNIFSRAFYRKSLLSPVLEHSGEVWVIDSHVEFKQPSVWIKTVLGGVSEKKKGQDQSPETDMASCGFCARGSSPGHSNSFFFP